MENILIGLKTDGTQQGRNGQLLLTVDVRIHDLIDIRSKLNPRAAERNDTRRVELRTIGVHRSTEEHARRTVQLADNDTLSTIDNKSTFGSHIGNRAQIDIRNNGIEILMIGIFATQAQFSLKRHAVGKTALNALLDRIAGRVDTIIQESQSKTIAGILNGEILLEYLEQPLVATLLRSSIHTEKLLERL